jgi:hypothetical protein
VKDAPGPAVEGDPIAFGYGVAVDGELPVAHIDDDILEEFRNRSDAAGYGYQTMMNQALRDYLSKAKQPIDARTLRRILREELKRAS